jgi:hypothetical protein
MKGSWRQRCDAWSKHTAARAAGKLRGISWRCRKWAVPGKTRCYLHGGKSTGPRTPEGKAASLRLEGRRRRIAQLALEGKKINTGQNGGRPRKDGQPMKRRTATRQQILAALAAMAPPDFTPEQEAAARRVAEAAEQRIHEKEHKKEHAERRKLLNLVFRGADANIRALAGRGPRDEDLVAQAQEAPAAVERAGVKPTSELALWLWRWRSRARPRFGQG